ncbi:hypothetical protein R3P38DRAFT_3324901 [Favolaschia claudopus]|uniref:Uncharacterized protein n=1 Tax=Favolaschia claudopus TaxID=2862362 RepID=A0AAW0AGU3_9AGAR
MCSARKRISICNANIGSAAGGGEPTSTDLFRHPDPVVTKTQNYPPALPILTQIQNTIQAFQLKVDEAHRRAKGAEEVARSLQAAQAAAAGAARKSKLKIDAKKSRLQHLTHSKARWLLSLGSADDGDDEPSNRLPQPLQPGEEPALLKDGKTKRAHPNWSAGVTDPVNIRFLESLKALVLEHVSRDNGTLYGSPDGADILKITKVFFGHLRKVWKTQNSAEGLARYRHKLRRNKWRQRKHEKADDHRRAVPKFRETFGEANTVGDYEIIQTDDMSSERSDCGEIDPATFSVHRFKSGGGENGWAIRPKAWQSSWLKLYFAHLKTLRREMLEDEKTKSLGASGSLAGKHRVPRYKSLPANTNRSAPVLIRKQPLYEAMVSDAWMKTEGITYEKIRAQTTPAEYTVFTLKLDTDGLHANEISYLADDEA